MSDGLLYVVGTTSTAWPVWDDSVTLVQNIDATHPTAAGWGYQPHPMAFYVASEGKWFILTFDDTRFNSSALTWGNVLVFESAAVAPTNTQPTAPTISHSALTATTVTLTGTRSAIRTATATSRASGRSRRTRASRRSSRTSRAAWTS